MKTLGLDIGGANLKAAHADGVVRSVRFPLWKHPERLASALVDLYATLPPFDELAITMTGELCDCFATKRQGVSAILDAVEVGANGRPIRVWSTAGRWLDPAEARHNHLAVAAANWHLLATYVAREYIPQGTGLLIDIGSTTTDIIPLENGRPVPKGLTDPERLKSGELLYCGVRRTPLCAVLGLEVAAEWFATMHDVYLMLDMTAEDETDTDTADGRPATKAYAHGRLAHAMCADVETFTVEEARELAERAHQTQMAAIERSVRKVGRSTRWIVSGSGGFVVRLLIPEMPRVVLEERLSAAACAYAAGKLLGV